MEDRYKIIKLINKDAAGGVYLAEDTMLGREVAFRHIDAAPDVERSKSWAKEMASYAGKLCSFQHPNIITIYDAPTDDDGVSIVTQYVKGQTLAERLVQGPLREIGSYRMASDLLEALHAVHEAGVYHGALHTGSIKRLPRASGGHRYLILDLGLNTLATMVKGQDIHIADPVLLPPELHDEDNKPDESADLFMVGQLCYTALAGGHPFSGKSAEECAAAHLAGELPPLTDYAPDTQEDFAAWVMKMCSGDRSERPKSIEEAMESLHQITVEDPEVPMPVATFKQDVPVAKAVVPVAKATIPVATVNKTVPMATANQVVPVATAKHAVPVATATAKMTVPMKAATVQQTVPMATVNQTVPMATVNQTVPMATGPQSTLAMTQANDFSGVQDDSNKKMIIIIASLAAVVALGIGLSFLFSGGDEEEKKQQSTSELALPPEGAKVHLHDVVLIGSKEDTGLVNLDGEKTLDWVVFTGANVSGARDQMPDRAYRMNPSSSGNFTEAARKGIPVFFEAGGKELTPMAATSAKAGKAKAGQGWDISMRVPKQHKGSMFRSGVVLMLR
jgi:serine/threonine protein kinase